MMVFINPIKSTMSHCNIESNQALAAYGIGGHTCYVWVSVAWMPQVTAMAAL